MNYYDARQVKESGKWHYTCKNDGLIWPVGYCADDCPGHDTKEEAYAHYKDYQLNECLSLDIDMRDTQRKCETCGAWTGKIAMVGGYDHWVLCDEHRTREEVAKRYTVGYTISSD